MSELVAPAWAGRGVTSDVPLDGWYVVAFSHALRATPLAVQVRGVPIVLFRDDAGRPAALLDRCPHRNVPLSLGRCTDGALECAYHGWRFGPDGACLAVPGLRGEPAAKARAAVTFPCVEQDGAIWLHSCAGSIPAALPPRFPHVGEAGYATVHDAFETDGTIHAVAENALDVPHTKFLHGGLFRSAKTAREIEVVLRRRPDRVEAEYVGEPAPRGLVGRILAPGGGMVRHWDRFLLPSLTQVEYRLGERSHVVVTSALTPLSADRTKLFAFTSVRLPLPHALVALFVGPIARRIFAQDARILAAQLRTVRLTGGERFVHTELDVLGPEILRLLKQAARGDDLPATLAREERRTMLV